MSSKVHLSRTARHRHQRVPTTFLNTRTLQYRTAHFGGRRWCCFPGYFAIFSLINKNSFTYRHYFLKLWHESLKNSLSNVYFLFKLYSVITVQFACKVFEVILRLGALKFVCNFVFNIKKYPPLYNVERCFNSSEQTLIFIYRPLSEMGTLQKRQKLTKNNPNIYLRLIHFTAISTCFW